MGQFVEQSCAKTSGERLTPFSSSRRALVRGMAAVDVYKRQQIGWAVQRSGAGRTRPGEAVSAHAGVETHKKIGEPVAAGETIFTVYAEQEARLEPVAEMLSRCFTLGSEPPAAAPLIYKIVV